MSVGDRIKTLRKKQNISQIQLAQALGVSRQAVSKWENDLASPDTIKLIQLADLLKTDSEYLATGQHSTVKSPPQVITMIQKVDNVVEKVVEKPVEVEKIVEIKHIVDRVVEVPKVRKVVRIRYLRNPYEFFLAALVGFIAGLLIGIII